MVQIIKLIFNLMLLKYNSNFELHFVFDFSNIKLLEQMKLWALKIQQTHSAFEQMIFEHVTGSLFEEKQQQGSFRPVDTNYNMLNGSVVHSRDIQRRHRRDGGRGWKWGIQHGKTANVCQIQGFRSKIFCRDKKSVWPVTVLVCFTLEKKNSHFRRVCVELRQNRCAWKGKKIRLDECLSARQYERLLKRNPSTQIRRQIYIYIGRSIYGKL